MLEPENRPVDQPSPTHPGWIVLPSAHLPQPNYFPSGMAMGTAFLFWGFITSYVIVIVGLTLFAASLAGWIHELRHERNHHS